MGNGNDRFILEDMVVDRHFRYIQGDGKSQFSMLRGTFKGTTTIRTGTGWDHMRTDSNRWEGNFSVTSSPAGRINLETDDDTYTRNYRLRGGNNDDKVRLLNDSDIHGTTNIDLRNGDDEFHAGVGVHFHGRVTARLGSGADSGSVVSSNVPPPAQLRLGKR